MKVIKNYLYNAFFQVFILIIPLITIPYLARVLGPAGVGINSYTNSIVQYFVLFGSIGVNLYGNRQIAFVRDDPEELTKTFYEIFLMRMMTVILACTAYGIFLAFTNKYQIYFLAQFLTIVAVGFDISWFFMGMENFAVTVFRGLLVKVMTLICIFAFVRSYQDLTTYILILSLSILLGNLALFPSLRKYLRKPNFSKLRPLGHLWPSLLLFFPQIATQIYLVLNKSMLGAIISVESAGFFDQSDKMVKMVLAIVTATGTVMLPRVAHAFAKGNHNRTKDYLYGSFSFVTALAVTMAFGLAAITPKFVPLFFTDKFTSVIPVMMIEAIVIVLIAWTNVIGTQYLLPTKQISSFTTSVVLGAIVNLIANVPLIIKFGAKGAAVATVLSELAVTIYQLIIVHKQINYRRLFEGCMKYLLAGALMFGLVFYLDKLMANNWLAIIIEITTGVLFYALLLIVTKAKIISQVILLWKR